MLLDAHLNPLCLVLNDQPLLIRPYSLKLLLPAATCTIQYPSFKAGETWTDPPGYYPQTVHPAYVFGHRHMFTRPTEDADENVEQGQLIREMSSWKKDDEQDRGGWAERFISGRAEVSTAQRPEGEVGQQLQSPNNDDTKRTSNPCFSKGTLHEFRPKEGKEGRDEMVDRALGLIWNTVIEVTRSRHSE
jgi:hypothetical protein